MRHEFVPSNPAEVGAAPLLDVYIVDCVLPRGGFSHINVRIFCHTLRYSIGVGDVAIQYRFNSKSRQGTFYLYLYSVNIARVWRRTGDLRGIELTRVSSSPSLTRFPSSLMWVLLFRERPSPCVSRHALSEEQRLRAGYWSLSTLPPIAHFLILASSIHKEEKESIVKDTVDGVFHSRLSFRCQVSVC